eukprot:CAMPEP_0170078508 /NCGR_PEP_ID=MMETSP0019_2-20121128/15081_1 /TAXON_ID=98059 /ORGANISM="Dinobryon sp., Strain UTEXLB2267" /LENGTH=704 /DNA_ID=CAMNT_0010291419 /DNA_START=412 /DNA_END=2526 /DNA_ORIENTATION=-
MFIIGTNTFVGAAIIADIYPGIFSRTSSVFVEILMDVFRERIVEELAILCRFELYLNGLLKAKLDSADVCISVTNILDRLTRSSNPAILEMVANPGVDLLSKVLLEVINLLKPHPTRRISPSQQSMLVAKAAVLVHRMVAWRASQAAVLQPLMVELLLLVPDEVEVVSAALKAIPSLLARLLPWIKLVHSNAVLSGPSFRIDPTLFAAIQQIVSSGMISDPASEMLDALEWATFTKEQQRQRNRMMKTYWRNSMEDKLSTVPLKGMLTGGPLSPAMPSWVTYLAFSSLVSEPLTKLLVRKHEEGEKSVMMAASYILASVEAHINMQISLIALLGRLPIKSMSSVWVEVCPGFEQMVAIHFNINEVDLFDKLLLDSKELDLYSCPDVVQNVEGCILFNSEPHLEMEILSQSDQVAKLSIIDTPINIQHEHLRNKNIQQNDFGVDSQYIHGTHVAGIAIQMNPNIQLLSFPAANITVLIDANDRSRTDIEVHRGDKGKVLTGIARLSAALTDFLNSNARVVNISAGIDKSDERMIAFISPLMKRLRKKGSIITIAAGNKSTNVDENGATDLLMSFVNKEMTEEVDGVRKSFRMDNMVAVAACDENDRLASFSNCGKQSVLLAASGVRVRSYTEVPNLFGIMDGTSQAAPQVAATLAMMVELFPTWSHTRIIEHLRQSVDPINDLTAVTIAGGILNTRRALDFSRRR